MKELELNQLIANARFTVFLGKNGSGKSTLLRKLDSSNHYNTKYISPERGGTLVYDANVENTISHDENWLINDRRRNRTEQFRQQSAVQFRNLEVLILREIEKNPIKRKDLSYTFDETLGQINTLLPKIKIRRTERGFDFVTKEDKKVPEENISSGESELIALAIEVLVYSRVLQENKVLLIDEPDVHLHPDLQQRFVKFIEEVATEFNFKVAIATHSTAIIGAFSQKSDLQIVPITNKEQTGFKYFNYDPICNTILPIFGNHPLSSFFNQRPILLVEGEDDQRVIEQLVRSSNGKYSFLPCVVGDKGQMNRWEKWLNEFLPSIYDNPLAFSLRDLDDSQQTEIEDFGLVNRIRLNCYSIENILLSNECLNKYGYSEKEFCDSLIQWAMQNPTHQTASNIEVLTKDFANRRTIKIKDLRNVIVALLGSTKPWEVVVGKLIASHIDNENLGPNSLHTYLGTNAIAKLFKLK